MLSGHVLRALAKSVAVAIFLVASLLASAAFAQGGDTGADTATARELFKQGIALSKQGRWEEAREKLARSLTLKATPLTYYTLAVAERESGRLVDALEHFRAFLVATPNETTEAYVEPARKAIAELEKRVARVLVRVEPADAAPTLSIDGIPVPEAALGNKRLVDPGNHVITVSAEGFEPVARSVSLAEGAHEELVITLQPDANADVNPADDFPTGPVLLTSAGVVIGVIGLTLGILGVEEARDAPTRDGDEADAARAQTIAGDVLMAVGGAATVAGLAWLIVELTSDDDIDPQTQSVSVGPAPGGIGLAVRF